MTSINAIPYVPLTIYTTGVLSLTVTLGTNITGHTFTAQVRPTADSPTVTATLTCTVTDAVNGVVVVSAPLATTSTLTPGTKGVWDLVDTVSGAPSPVLGGDVQIVQGVTR